MNAAATDYRADLLVQADKLQDAGDTSMERLAANLLNLGTVEPSMSKKPKITALADGSFVVSFGWGGRAEINPHADGGWCVSEFARDSWKGPYDSFECAVLAAARLTFIPDVFNPWGTATEVQALALECNRDRTLFVKTIKRIAKTRFGVKLSARGSTGTGYGWVHVKAPVDALGADVIAKVLCAHGTIRPCGGERVAIICGLAGHPLPDGFVVRPPQWD